MALRGFVAAILDPNAGAFVERAGPALRRLIDQTHLLNKNILRPPQGVAFSAQNTQLSLYRYFK